MARKRKTPPPAKVRISRNVPQGRKKRRGNNKDRIAKVLLDYNDIFSSVLNVLVFKGKIQIPEEELIPGQTHSIYKMDGDYREQMRDVAKYWQRGGARIMMLGIEHQSSSLRHMIVRTFFYDGAEYARQVAEKRPAHGVKTVVLYFGSTHWSAPRSLREYLRASELNTPEEELLQFPDYPLEVIEFAFLSDETIALLHPDLQALAYYLRAVREGRESEFSFEFKGSSDGKKVVRHLEETVGLLKAISQINWDEVFSLEDFCRLPDQEEKTVENYIKTSFERNNQKIREESLEEGRAEGAGMLQRLIQAMKNAGKTLEFIFTETSDSAKLPGLYKQYGITA